MPIELLIWPDKIDWVKRFLSSVLVFCIWLSAAYAYDFRCRFSLSDLPDAWRSSRISDSEFDLYESKVKKWLQSQSDESLQSRIEKRIQKRLLAKGYLPGLTPEWNLKSYSELIEDIQENKAAIDASRFSNSVRNIESISSMYRFIIGRKEGEARITALFDGSSRMKVGE